MLFENEAQRIRFAIYGVNAGMLVFKLFFVALSTGFVRERKKVVLNPEDAKVLKIEDVATEEHPNVARVKRAHLNDLENIPAFLFISLVWIHTEPDIVVCHVLMWLFTFARYMHTAVYAYYPVPQPARGICFILGLLITLYMIVMIFVTMGPWLIDTVIP